MLDKEQLKQMSTWTGFVGIMTIIGGVLSCISIVGIIPGIISIILGLKLRSAKKYSDEIIANPDDSMQAGKVNLLMSDLTVYFKVQGILIIVGFVFAVIAIIFSISMGAFAFSQFSNSYY